MQDESFGTELQVLANGIYALGLNVTDYILKFFLKGRCGNIHMFLFMSDEEVQLPFSKQSKCERACSLKYNMTQIQFIQTMLNFAVKPIETVSHIL